MTSRFDTWESYFYPPPDEGTLRNRFGERDAALLQRLEFVETADRYRELAAGEVVVARTFDAGHVRAIHRHLFGDVYEWAGQCRTVNMRKDDPRGFADATAGEIDRYLVDVHRSVTETPWDELDRRQFAERAATVFAYLNQAHPFREGNGRTSKLFMEHVVQLSRFAFDYSAVTPGEWNQASMLSAPDLYSYQSVPGTLIPVFEAIAVGRTSPPA